MCFFFFCSTQNRFSNKSSSELFSLFNRFVFRLIYHFDNLQQHLFIIKTLWDAIVCVYNQHFLVNAQYDSFFFFFLRLIFIAEGRGCIFNLISKRNRGFWTPNFRAPLGSRLLKCLSWSFFLHQTRTKGGSLLLLRG